MLHSNSVVARLRPADLAMMGPLHAVLADDSSHCRLPGDIGVEMSIQAAGGAGYKHALADRT